MFDERLDVGEPVEGARLPRTRGQRELDARTRPEAHATRQDVAVGVGDAAPLEEAEAVEADVRGVRHVDLHATVRAQLPCRRSRRLGIRPRDADTTPSLEP